MSAKKPRNFRGLNSGNYVSLYEYGCRDTCWLLQTLSVTARAPSKFAPKALRSGVRLKVFDSLLNETSN